MKRNRAMADPSPKAQKRCKDLGTKGAGKERAAEKPRNKDDVGEKRASTEVASVASPEILPAAQEQEWWDGAGEIGWWWGSCGVEEEILLGWFPFVEEHFLLCSDDNRGGGSGLFWEEDHDIWQLQHIHEIPNSDK